MSQLPAQLVQLLLNRSNKTIITQFHMSNQLLLHILVINNKAFTFAIGDALNVYSVG